MVCPIWSSAHTISYSYGIYILLLDTFPFVFPCIHHTIMVFFSGFQYLFYFLYLSQSLAHSCFLSCHFMSWRVALDLGGELEYELRRFSSFLFIPLCTAYLRTSTLYIGTIWSGTRTIVSLHVRWLKLCLDSPFYISLNYTIYNYVRLLPLASTSLVD